MLVFQQHREFKTLIKGCTLRATSMLMPRYLDSSTSSGSHGAAGATNSSSSPPTTVAAHTKMRLLSKVEHNMRQSQGHIQSNQSNASGQDINHLLHTASTGNGVVDDVDGLLTPMRIKAHMSPPYSAGSSVKSDSLGYSPRPERNLWSRAEMLEMLSIMQNLNALEQLNDRNMKSEQVFRQIEEVMRSKGFVKKSSIQIWTKWKFLKSTYNTTTRHGTGVPKVVPEEVYRVLCRMLSDTNHGGGNSNVNGSLSECGNSMDSSKTAGDDNKEDILGVEHPIFGFRLGPIKPEPIDIGEWDCQNESMLRESLLKTRTILYLQAMRRPKNMIWCPSPTWSRSTTRQEAPMPTTATRRMCPTCRL